MSGSTSILDSLPAVGPTPGMMAAGMATPSGVAARNGDTSVLDSLPAVAPTPGMVAANPQQAATWSSIGQNFAAGANRALFGALGAPVDLASRAVNDITANPISGYPGVIGSQPVGGSTWLEHQWRRLTGTNPENVWPTNEPERIAAATGGAVASIPIMGAGGAALEGAATAPMVQSVGRALQQSSGFRAVAPVATGAAIGQAAEDAAPKPLKPVANLVGNLAGGAGVAGVESGAAAMGRQIGRQAGMIGIGPRGYVMGVNGEPLASSDGLPLRVTETQRNAIAQRLANAAGPDLATARSDLNFAPEQLVPGSQPTTAQVAPVPGLVSLETAHRVAAPEQFNARTAAQNSARLSALQGLAPENAQPGAVGAFFRQQLDQIDQSGQRAVSAAQQGVQRATNALGGFGTPAAYGEQARLMLENANAVAQARERQLWQAVDPDGTLALPAASIRSSAQQILQNVNPQVGDTLAPGEAAILNGAAGLPDVIRFGDLSKLRSNIGTTQRALAPTYGWDSVPQRRLGMLKSSVDDAISNAVDGRAAQEAQAVSAGQMSPEQTMLANINTWVAGQRAAAGETAATNMGAGVAGGQSARPGTGAQPLATSGMAGTVRPSGGQVGGTAGVQSVSGQAQPLVPNFSQSNADAYAAARQATLERKQTYRAGPVGRVLRPGPGGAEYAVPDANVTGQFLTGRPDEAGRVQNFSAAAGNGGQELLRDALVADLRRSGIVQQDGTLKPSSFADWQRRRADTIRQFPGLGDQFANASAAQDALNAASASHEAALANFQKSAAASFIKDDPMVAVRRAFGSSNPTETFNGIVSQVRGNADAEAGLKRAVVDYVLDKMTSTRAATDTEDFLKADAFRRWLRTNTKPLKTIFGGQGVQNLDAVAADLRRGAYSGVSAGGSPTATYANAVKRRGLVPGGHGGEAVGVSVLTLLGEQLGEHVAGHGLIGAAALPAAGIAVHALRQASVRTLNDLERMAMLHPNVARELLARVGPNGKVGPLAQRRLATAIQGVLGANAVRQTSGAAQ